jgi:hypothetical protein
MTNAFSESKHTMTSTRTCLILVAALILLRGATCEAQVIRGQTASASFGVCSQSWELRNEIGMAKLSQQAFPLTFFLPLKNNYQLTIFTSAALTSLDNSRSESTLDGFNDTKIQFEGSFSGDRYLLSLAMNLPSGRKSLSQEEVEIAQLLSLDFLNLPVKNFGEGIKVSVSLARAFQWSSTVWGLGAGYQYNGDYQPYHDLPDYKPGDRAYLSGGVSLITDKVKLSSDLTYILYQTDKAGGEKIFKDGNQLDAKGTFSLDRKRYSLALVGRLIVRDKDERYAVGRVLPGQGKSHGDDFRFLTSFSLKAGAGINVTAEAETKYIRENDYHISDPLHLGRSQIIGVGGGMDWKLKGDHSLELHIKRFKGDADGGNLDLSGLQIQGNLLLRF